jgi:hypothetical protein
MKTYEIHPLIGLNENMQTVDKYEDAKYFEVSSEKTDIVICWGVYEKLPEGGVKNLFDVPTRDNAEQALKVLTVLEVEKIIDFEVSQLQNDVMYEVPEEVEEEILEALEAIGYTFAEDEKAQAYFLKATPEEIWEYYLSDILPNL